MHAWYSYDIGRGYKTWNTAAEAEADANSCFEQFRKKSSDGWCGIAMIEWGFLIAHGETQPNHDGSYTMVDVSEESPLERTCRQLEQAERERDEAREQVAMLRQALKTYYHECKCQHAEMDEVNRQAYMALRATDGTEDKP